MWFFICIWFFSLSLFVKKIYRECLHSFSSSSPHSSLRVNPFPERFLFLPLWITIGDFLGWKFLTSQQVLFGLKRVADFILPLDCMVLSSWRYGISSTLSFRFRDWILQLLNFKPMVLSFSNVHGFFFYPLLGVYEANRDLTMVLELSFKLTINWKLNSRAWDH